MPQLGQHAVGVGVAVGVAAVFLVGIGVDVGGVVGIGKLVFLVVGGGDSGGCDDDMVSVIVADMSLPYYVGVSVAVRDLTSKTVCWLLCVKTSCPLSLSFSPSCVYQICWEDCATVR